MSRGLVHESINSGSVEWYTPARIFDALGLAFDLDPCSPGAGRTHVSARRHFTVADDGLALPWSGLVFLNPPYGRHSGAWLEKLARHSQGVALVFARTDVRWFHDHGARAEAMCFLDGRVKFERPDGNDKGSPGAGSMLLGFGDRAATAVRTCGLGLVLNPRSGPRDLITNC